MADRTVTFDLLAADKASEALSKVGREVGTLSEKIDKAGGTINVDADTAKAREKLAAIDSQLGRLNAKSLKVDADTAQAQRQLAVLNAELKRTSNEDARMRIEMDISTAQAKLRALAAEKVSIDVDTNAAHARLRALESTLNGVSGKTAKTKVDADVSGAIANIGRLLATLALIPASMTVAVGAVGYLSVAGLGLGGAMTAGIAGTRGLSDAVKAMGDQTTKAGGAAKVSASAIRSANQAVVDARRDLVRANEDVKIAEADLARAQDDAKRVQEGLTQARKDATRQLEDMRLRSESMALQQQSAELSVQEAQARLVEVNKDSKSTSLDRARAELNVAEALQRQKELSVEATRLTEDKTAADKKGVEGSDQVVTAQQRIADANRRVEDAQRNLARAHENVTRATERVAEAVARLQEASHPSGGGGSGVDKLKEAMDNLGPNAQKFARYLYDLEQGPLKKLRQAGQEEFLPGVQRGLEYMEKQIPGITPKWASFSREVGNTTGELIKMGSQLAGPLITVSDQAFQGLQPLMTGLQGLERDLAATFTRMSQTGEAKQAMQALSGVVAEMLPLIPDLVEGGAKIAIALGPGLQAVVKGLSGGIHDMLPNLIGMAESVGQLLEALGPFGPQLVTAYTAVSLFRRMGGDLSPILNTVRAGFDRLRGSAREAGDAVDGAGVQAGRAEGRMATLHAGLNRVGLALVASNVAGQAFGKDVGTGVSTASKALEEYVRTGKMAVNVGGDWERTIKSMSDSGYNGFNNTMNRITESVAGLSNVDLGPFGEGVGLMKERIQSLDAALTDMVQRGQADLAAQAFKRISDEAQKQGTSVDALKQAFPGYTNALDSMGSSAQQAAAKLDQLNQAQHQSASQMMTTEQAALRYAEQVDRMSQSIRDNGNTMNINTEKGRANKEALLGLVQAANDNISALERSGAPLRQVTGAYETQKAKLIETATQLLGSRDKAQIYINKLLEVPKNLTTTVTANTSAAEQRIQDLRAKLWSLQGLTMDPHAGEEGHGKYVYKSTGGWVGQASRSGAGMTFGGPRGSDTVPSWLSPDEFVVKSSAARQWGPLLEAINAGATPSTSPGLPALLPLQRASAASGGGGAGSPTILQVSLQGVLAGDQDAFARAVLEAIVAGVNSGQLPRTLLPTT